MSPSGGFDATRMRTFTFYLVWLVLLPSVAAQKFASATYFMDIRSDCLAAGYQLVRRDQVTTVYGRSEGSGGTQINCYLQFQPEERRDLLRVTMEGGSYISDPAVSLEVEMSGAGSYSFGYLSGSLPGPLEAEGGKATLRIKRGFISNTDFYIKLTVTAKESIEAAAAGGSSSGDTGMIVGIIAGVVVAIIIIAIIAMCCIRKRKENANGGAVKELKQDLTKESLNTSVGYDNSQAKSYRTGDSTDESPRSDRKLLASEKPRSALDRFGTSPGQRRRTLDSKGDDYDDVERGRGRGVYEEREVNSKPDDRPGYRGPRDDDVRRDYENREYVGRENEYSDNRRRPDHYDRRRGEPYNDGRRRDDYEDQEMRRPEEDPRRSPLLSALRQNPQFRRSLHDAENSPETRANHPQRGGANDSVSSSVSVDSNGVPNRPKLPPVPKSPPRSPSPQRRGEKIAAIFRARPSSSGSEIVRVGEENAVEESSGTDRSPGTHVSRRDQEEKKHSLRPNRGDRKPNEEGGRRRRGEDEEEDEDSGEDRRWRRKEKEREKDRKEEERARRKKQEEEEEEEEERRRKKEREKKKKREEEKRREEEEEEEERRKRKERDDDKYEGRFKKSASGRRSKGKAPRMGRSRSTGNALEEMEANYQRSRSKSPSSVRSLNFIEDDDEEDADSNYMPFRRAGSKTSLYTSRTSLTGRRRKNSMGETMSLSSYARTDDMDSRMGDFRGSNMSHREKERLFRSTGDLEMRPASAQIVRDVASQTGTDRGVYIYGKRTLAVGRVGKRYSRGTQTYSTRERRDSTGSAKSGKSGRSTRSNRLKSRSKSQESLRKMKRSRSRGLDDIDDDDSDRSRRRGRSKSRDRDYTDDDDDDDRRRRKHRSKSRGLDDDDDDDARSKSSRSKPRARPRKSTGTASVDLSDSEDDFDDGKSGVTSSVAPSSVYAPAFQPGYGPAMIPVAYPPQAGMPYLPTAPGGPPVVMAVPPPQVPGERSRPPVAPKPKQSKWDQLVSMTDGEKQRRQQFGGSVAETESVFSYGAAAAAAAPQVVYAPPSYTTAQRLPDPNSTYSSSYPNSSGDARTPRDYKFSGSVYTDSVV